MAERRESANERELGTPWITYLLVALAVVGFVYTKSARESIDARIADELVEAATYFEEHPYLDLPPLLELKLPRERAVMLAATFERNRIERGSIPTPPAFRAEQQALLEAMVGEAGKLLDALPVRSFGVDAAAPRAHTFVTHLFVHGNGLHLIVALLAVVLTGYFLEGVWGSAVHAGVVLFAAVIGAALFTGQASATQGSFVGMLGLAAGLTGAFLVRLSGLSHVVPYAFVALLVLPVLAVGAWFGWSWSVSEGPAAPLLGSGGTSPLLLVMAVDFLACAALAFVLRLFGPSSVQEHVEAPVRTGGGRAQSRFDQALQLRAAGRLEPAFEMLSALVRNEPEHLDANLMLWELANEMGRPSIGGRAMLRVIREELQRNQTRAAIDHWLELKETGLALDAEPALSLRIADVLRKEGLHDGAAAALRFALQQAQGESAKAIATRVAREAADLDPQLAQEAVWMALNSHELGLQERQEMESLLAVLQEQVAQAESAASAAPRTDPTWEKANRKASRSAQASVVDAEPATADSRQAIEIEESQRGIELASAVPVQFAEDGFYIRLDNAQTKRIRYDRIQAVGVAAVDGLGERTVILVDLVLNWMSLTEESLQVIRLRGDRFDPLTLVEGQTEPLQALRAFIAVLLEKTGAVPLPDLQSASGMPFAAFASLAAYQRDVLMVHAS